ncbi:MAG: hypothetical protein E5W15_23770 [Mesorhizobium sp.]|nr:MAG: hypothetical protein E5W15_23770 [Mesorhizobium sp.]
MGFNAGPNSITRVDRSRSATIEADLSGLTLGQATEAIRALPAMRNLPASVHELARGDAQRMQELFSGFATAIAAGIILMYLTLVLLFRSFVQPVTILVALPLSVGGDHSISHPILKAVGKKAPVGMIHIDAHCDTSGLFDMTKFHHGGPFRNAVLDGVLDPSRTIQIGIRGSAEYLWEFTYESGMTVVHAEEVTGLGIPAIIEKARQIVGDGPTYISFDVDSIDPAFAPGTGTPEVGGLTTREVLELLRGLKGLNIVGGDVVEVAPQYDSTTNTAHVGAQVLFEILSLMVFSPAIKKG